MSLTYRKSSRNAAPLLSGFSGRVGCKAGQCLNDVVLRHDDEGKPDLVLKGRNCIGRTTEDLVRQTFFALPTKLLDCRQVFRVLFHHLEVLMEQQTRRKSGVSTDLGDCCRFFMEREFLQL